MRIALFVSLLSLTVITAGCGSDQGDERLAEKAKIEGTQTAKEEAKVQLEEKEKQVRAELQAQIDNIELVKQKAREEGKATAKAELQSQIENIDLIRTRAREEGKAQAQADIAEQNANLSRRSDEMESDLKVRHRFFQAVRGVYEGSLKAEKKEWQVRVTLVPSLPPYNVNRVRQLDEVASDLNNLYFNAQVVQWNPKDKSVATSCRVEHVRPDIVNGEVTIASENCPNLYFLQVAEGEEPSAPTTDAASENDATKVAEKADMNTSSASLALAIREGRTSRVKKIQGSVQPATDASVYELTVTRVSR